MIGAKMSPAHKKGDRTYMYNDEEKIGRKDAAKELGISLSSLDRAVKSGELHYANQDSPKGAHKFFTRADLENFARLKPLKQQKTADIVENFLKDPSSAEHSPLGKLVSESLRWLPLDIVLEISTTSPRKGPRLYVSKFPLIRQKSDLSEEAHAAAVLALAYLISEGDGVCEARDFKFPGMVSHTWGPDANQTLQEYCEDICNRLLRYAHAWVPDHGAFERTHRLEILKFLRGAGCGGGLPGKCIVIDYRILYSNRSRSLLSAQYEQAGTTVTAYLTVPLP